MLSFCFGHITIDWLIAYHTFIASWDTTSAANWWQIIAVVNINVYTVHVQQIAVKCRGVLFRLRRAVLFETLCFLSRTVFDDYLYLANDLKQYQSLYVMLNE